MAEFPLRPSTSPGWHPLRLVGPAGFSCRSARLTWCYTSLLVISLFIICNLFENAISYLDTLS